MKIFKNFLLFFLVIGVASFVSSISSVDVVKSCEDMISKNLLSSCVAQDNKTGEDMSSKNVLVKKKVLPNGLTVLVKEVHNIPKVSTQVFYNVGSKNEKTGEKGIAHLIEHMVFKGTKKLSDRY